MLPYDPRLKGHARSLRARLTEAEQRLWARLRRKQIHGVQFYRQKPIGHYIADFYAPAVRLIVEVDGSQHLDRSQAEHDRRRTAYLEQQGLRVLRFTDRQVLLELNSVVEEIFRAMEDRNPPSPPFSKGGGRDASPMPLLQQGGRDASLMLLLQQGGQDASPTSHFQSGELQALRPPLCKGGRGGIFAVAIIGVLLALVGALAPMPGAWAHESRPAYLEIKETSPGRYAVLWRTPILSGMHLPVVVKFSDDVHNVTGPVLRELPDSLVERRLIDTGSSGLVGKRIEFVGLQATITDVLVRMQMRDGVGSTTLVRPSQAWVEVAGSPGLMVGASAYFTLAIATLGYAQAPEPPLTATIALSILFLGPEIVRSRQGETSLTIRHSWVVAFAFGLLHGFGFASGLTTMGLPRVEIPLALLVFNMGVEAGQLLFVIVVLLLERSFHRLEVRLLRLLEALPAYAVGSLGAYWTIQRVVIMLGGTR